VVFGYTYIKTRTTFVLLATVTDLCNISLYQETNVSRNAVRVNHQVPVAKGIEDGSQNLGWTDSYVP
jgi:hypothetical protein